MDAGFQFNIISQLGARHPLYPLVVMILRNRGVSVNSRQNFLNQNSVKFLRPKFSFVNSHPSHFLTVIANGPNKEKFSRLKLSRILNPSFSYFWMNFSCSRRRQLLDIFEDI